MLKQVREAGATRHLVFGADVIPNVDGDSWRGVVLRENHRETVWQFVSFKWDLDGVGTGLIFLLTQHRLGQRDRQDKGKRRQ